MSCSIVELLIQKEILLQQYDIRTNEDELSKLLHPEFTEVGKSGRSFNFQNIVEYMRLEKQSSTKIHSQDYECIELGDNAYLLLYRTAVIGGKGAVSDYAKRFSVWTNDGEDWKLRYHQGTPCARFQLRRTKN